jgi:TRAP-type C4-dicarboxylate transport system permease small subunit
VTWNFGLSRLARCLVGALILIPLTCAALIRWYGYGVAHMSRFEPLETPSESVLWLYFFAPICSLCLLFVAIVVWRDLRKPNEPTVLRLPPHNE